MSFAGDSDNVLRVLSRILEYTETIGRESQFDWSMTFDLLELIYNFVRDAMKNKQDIGVIISTKLECRPLIASLTSELLKNPRCFTAVAMMGERLASHAEYYSLDDGCMLRSAFEFFRMEFAESINVYIGDLRVPDKEKDWSNCVKLKEYTDILIKPQTVEVFDAIIKHFIFTKTSEGELLSDQDFECLPQSHWWWRYAASSP
ncbi:hypothetical protein ACOME3_004003 [Neoechinorhynchus agilis]